MMGLLLVLDMNSNTQPTVRLCGDDVCCDCQLLVLQSIHAV